MPARRSITIGSRNEHGLEVVEVTSKRRDSGKLVTILLCKCLAGLTDDCKGQVEVEQPNFARTKACGPCAGWQRSSARPKRAPKAEKPKRQQTPQQKAKAEQKTHQRERASLEDLRFAANLAVVLHCPAPPPQHWYELDGEDEDLLSVALKIRPLAPGECSSPHCERCSGLGDLGTVQRRFTDFQDEFIEAGRDVEAYEEAWNHPESLFWAQKAAKARAQFALARERDRNAF